MDAWMFNVLQLVSQGLWCVISLYHICPSKVRAYNSKGELKILLFMYVLLLVCNLTCHICFGGGYKGRGSGYK